MTAVVVGGALAVATTDAPANNRSPEITFFAFPGPSEVTFGKNVSYTTSFRNNSTSMYTNVNFTMDAPTTMVGGVEMRATLVYASCEPTGPPFTGLDEDAASFSCPTIKQLPAGSDTVKHTLVWQTPIPANPDSLVCGQDGTDCTLAAQARWAIKENQPGSNDTFERTDTTALLVQPDKSRAGGYPISKCEDPTTQSSLETNDRLGTDNPLATKVCAPELPTLDPLNPGLVIVVKEGPKLAGDPAGIVTQVSDICIPAKGTTCPSDSTPYDPYLFGTDATFTFTVNNRTLPKGFKITKAFHNGNLLTTTANSTGHYLASITIDNAQKTTTIVTKGPSNGRWGFG